VYSSASEEAVYRVLEEARGTDLIIKASGVGVFDALLDGEEFLFSAANEAPECRFLLGGNGWDSKPMPANMRYIGHV